MQVFYVNIGGGEPTVRTDFWELVDYATAHDVGVKFSTNGSRITPEQRRAAGGQRLRRRADLARRRDAPRSTTPSAVPGSFATAIAAMERLAEAGMRRLQDLGGRDARERRPARRVQGDRGPLRRAAAADAAAAVRARRGRLGRAASDRGAAARSSTTGCSPHGEKVLTGDSFFHLAAYGRAAAGPEPVRRRPRRLPDRSDRRRLRVPVRDPRGVPRRQRARDGRLRARCGASRSCSRSCASRRPAARARRARTTTRAAAAAWRRSSSPACRSTARTRSACSATASRCSRRCARSEPCPRPSADHSRSAAPASDRARASPLRWPASQVSALMAGGWFETVAEAQRRAKKRLPKSVYKAHPSPGPSTG